MKPFSEYKISINKVLVLRGIIFFLILLVLLYFSNIIGKYIAVKYQNKEALGTNIVDLDIMREKKNTIDVLAIGDSECYTSFSPLDLWEKNGITSFTLAKSGERLNDSYHLLKNTLKYQNPKLVLIETDMIFQTYGRLHDFMHNIKNDLFYNMYLTKYHSIWKILVEKNITRYNSYKGFNFYSEKAPYNGDLNYMNKEKYHKPLFYINEIYLKRIIDMCKKKGIKVVMYSAPSPNNYSKATNIKLNSLSKKYKVPFIDMNLLIDKIGIDYKVDSLDNGDHVNVSGTNKIMTYFSSYISKFNIKDKRNDIRFSDWNDLLYSYTKKRDSFIKRIRS